MFGANSFGSTAFGASGSSPSIVLKLKTLVYNIYNTVTKTKTFVYSLFVGYNDLYSSQGDSYSDVYSPQATSYVDEYTH